MEPLVYELADRYPLAMLYKQSAYNRQEIDNVYLQRLLDAGVNKDEIVNFTLPYNRNNKAPVAWVKARVEELLESMDELGVQVIYCADAAYFKSLTKQQKAEAHLGYVLDCAWEGYEHMKVVLGINHKSLLYNPNFEPKLDMSIATLIAHCRGEAKPLGEDIIHREIYPETPTEVEAFLDGLHQYPEIACDIEAFSLRFEEAAIGTISFAWSQHEGGAFAVDYVRNDPETVDETGLHGRCETNAPTRAMLKQFFETYRGRIRWHGSSYDLKVLIYGLWMDNLLDNEGLLQGLDIMTQRFDCTKIITYLAINSCAGNRLGLKELAHAFAGNWAQEEIDDIRKIPLSNLLRYNLIDTLCTNYVYDKYWPIVQADEQEDLYWSMMLPTQKMLLQTELTGMPLNPERVQEVKTILQDLKDKAEAAIYAMPVIDKMNHWVQHKAMVAKNKTLKIKQHPIEAFAHITFNPGSDQQKQQLLYEFLELPVIDYTDTKQPAVGKKTLEKLIHHTDDDDVKRLLESLMDYANASKILSTFIPAFERAIDKGDGVVWLHGNFNVGGTKSGRLSSSDPNLQNIPSGSAFGKLIKSCFQAPDGWLFCGADFNSLEDYISALTTRDPNKLKVYEEGYDGHSLRAFSYWPEKFPFDEITPELSFKVKKDPLLDAVRSASKGPTFALTYQGTFLTLMKDLGFSENEAKRIEANYHELYKVSDQWVDAKLDEAAQRGYVECAFGLRLRTPLLKQTLRNHSTTPSAARAEGRTAGNALGQSYGLLNNRAAVAFMEKVWASPYRNDVKPVALIHDAIYLVIRNDVDVVKWVNDHLIAEMQWQELPELKHDTVKLGAELDIFYPTWAEPMTLPNKATVTDIRKHVRQHRKALAVKQAA